MEGNIISLRQFIDNKDNVGNIKVQTFCRLMKIVSDEIEKEERNIIRVNLDEIKIDVETGRIVLPDNLFSNPEDLDKTIAGFNTGISLMADRKSSKEHKRVSFALMVLGWYCNPDHSAIINDMDVLENFDTYMSKVPAWLQDFFIGVFRRMDYETSFGDYYDKNFTEKIRSEIKEAFKDYNLDDEQFNKICKIVANETKRLIKEGEQVG